ncbi:MAG: BTAD domain-containing putative transcriptional regulator [Eubacteriales bacterium]|nr:BTAD domain-containing putative transcriptional regulator [Eubacteriales bacterium]
MDTITAKVQMLGGFCMTINDITITDQTHQSKKPWSILEYLIAFRNREVSSGELIDLIWSENQSVNPGGALKTLVFRTRKLLEPFGIPPHDLVIQRRGTYAWNPRIELTVDTDLFDDLLARSNDSTRSDEERLDLLLQALELYQGDYLPKSGCEAWVIPLSTYYHSQFIQAAHQAIDLLTEQEAWARISSLCRKAIEIEPFDDNFHYHLIYSLYNQGKQMQALEHYQHTTNMFYNEFAITPSEQLKELYKLIQDKEHGIAADLSVIQDSMKEASHPSGAYCCEYPVFRDLYQLERRTIARTGDSIYLGLVTISDEGGELPKPFITTRAMNHMDTAIASSLRRGDAYTRYSVSQYLVMLPTTSHENGEVVMQRIVRNFRKLYVRKELNVTYSLQAIAPATAAEMAPEAE